MAYTYENLPLLSKVKIGEQVYYLKDAEVRKIMDTFGSAVTYSVDTTFNTESANLVTSNAIATYLEDAISGLTSAMHFVGVKEALPISGDNGDIVIVGSAEYVWSDEKVGGAGWILIGDEGVYATIAGVEAAYVKKTLTIAGIDLADAITADELKSALGLKALAYKDSASGTIEGVVTGVQDATYTPAGSVAIARDDANGTAVSGTVSAPTVTVTPATTQVQHIDSVGSLPTYTAAQYTAPSVNEASAQFATAGMLATVDANETLVISDASKAAALTGTGFNAGSYTAAEFNAGALPTLGAAQTVVTGIASATASAPTFTGDKFGAAFTGTEATISHGVTTGNKSVTVQ